MNILNGTKIFESWLQIGKVALKGTSIIGQGKKCCSIFMRTNTILYKQVCTMGRPVQFPASLSLLVFTSGPIHSFQKFISWFFYIGIIILGPQGPIDAMNSLFLIWCRVLIFPIWCRGFHTSLIGKIHARRQKSEQSFKAKITKSRTH